VAECLLEHGCDVNHAENNGDTALHLTATRSGRLAVAQLLLRYGAKLNVRNNAGQTAADIATRSGNTNIAAAIRAEENLRRAFLLAAEEGDLAKVQLAVETHKLDPNRCRDVSASDAA